MNRLLILFAFTCAAPLLAQEPTQLTIYNQDFAVARTTVPLKLQAGANEVLTTQVTSQLEPDSVILRDPTGKHPLKVSEQNYDAGIVTQQWMLSKYEGQTVDFQVGGSQIVKGKIIRAGDPMRNGDTPLVEVDGHLQFQLPGMPLFPAGTGGLLLKPTLRWQIAADSAASFPAELDYITHGMSWQATYNVVLPEAAATSGKELADVVGWVTIQNNSGTDFPAATIQLMAGDVAKLIEARGRQFDRIEYSAMAMAAPMAPTVTQKAFDDFHLYDLHRTLALPSGETKQVEFLTANAVTLERTYEFNATEPIQQMNSGYFNSNRNWGSLTKPQVSIREEIRNSKANHLGMPLPAGRIRLYRREDSGQMQFVGESTVGHTPEDQSLHIISGKSFDLTGERKQTDFHTDSQGHNMDETLSIKLSNAKAAPVTVHVVEHLNRGQNWQIVEKNTDYSKTDSSTIDFKISVPAHGDASVNYTVHYTW